MRLKNGSERIVAVKTLKPASMSAEKFLEEAAVMKSLRNQNVVLLLAICNDPNDMFIVTEFMDKGSSSTFHHLQWRRGDISLGTYKRHASPTTIVVK